MGEDIATRDGSNTAHEFVRKARQTVEEVFGPGACERHPEFVVVTVHAAIADLLASNLRDFRLAYEARDEIPPG